MHSISSLINKAVTLLLDNKIDTPRLDAEILIAHALNIKRSFIIMNPDYQVNNKQEQIFWNMINKRISHCPVSKIIGEREFWSLNFTVNNTVLDPRPDSETIISSVMKLYKCKNQNLKIADLGTGTGCILISLLSHYKNAKGVAFEKSVLAYRIAYQNICKHRLHNRILLLLSSWNNCSQLFDIIVSNPPYIKRNKIKDLQKEVKLYDPIIALDGGITGLESYFQIMKVIKKCLKKNGKAVIEIGESQEQIHRLVHLYGLKFHSYAYDLFKKKRCIIITKN